MGRARQRRGGSDEGWLDLRGELLGGPRFAPGGTDTPCAHTQTSGVEKAGSEFIDFKAPDAARTAFVSIRAWKDSGYFDVFVKGKAGLWMFQRRIMAHNPIQHTTGGGTTDGNIVVLAATGLEDYSHVRILNRKGRIYFSGLGFSRQSKLGAGGNGFVDWESVTNRPKVAYEETIPAGDYKQPEVDNVRANKLADGSQPWTEGDKHNHKYDVNSDNLQRADNAHFVAYGKQKSMVFRTDGSGEYQNSGVYSFIWLEGGVGLGNRSMALSKAGLEVKGSITAGTGVFLGKIHVAKGDQECGLGEVLKGFDGAGNKVCITDADTTYDGTTFALTDQKCGTGEHMVGHDAKGLKICATDQDTTYDGTNFATSGQSCADGEQLIGFDKDGVKVCEKDRDTQYDGTVFALADKKCSVGEVQVGIDKKGEPLCIFDAGLNLEVKLGAKDASALSVGNWTLETGCWGIPRIATGDSASPCAFTKTTEPGNSGAETIEFKVPTGMKTAYVSSLGWKDSGTFDVYARTTAGLWKFVRRITTHQVVQNFPFGGTYDGNTVYLAATGLDGFSHVRLQNVNGRLYFTGMGFTREDRIGAGSTGFVDWSSVVNRPNVAYVAKIPADNFTQDETDNVRANKLADGSAPWTDGAKHNHKYDVNSAALKRADTEHMVLDGLKKSMVFRNDGDTEYASSGQFPFVWLNGGTGATNRAMGLSKAGLNVAGDVTAGNGVYIGSVHVAKGDQKCESGEAMVGVDDKGAMLCQKVTIYTGADFMEANQKCPDGEHQTGVDDKGKILCGRDVGLDPEWVLHFKDNSGVSAGGWSESTGCWGEPKFAEGGFDKPCAFTITVGSDKDADETVDFAVPSGARTAWISVRAWSDSGYFDVFAKNKAGLWRFQRRIMAYNNVQNQTGASHDGNVVLLAATGLDHFSHVRLHNRKGRLYFSGMAFSREDMRGGASTGFIDWANVINRPNVAYTDKIPADKITETETTNLRASKLADGKTPWKDGAEHNHKYDVNSDRLKRADSKNFVVDGQAKQLAFRADGTTEYSTGVGAYPFVWMNGGDQTGDRAMALSKAELNVTGKITGTNGVYTGGAHVAKGNQTCKAGEQVTGVDSSGVVICKADANTTYSGANFGLSNQSCADGEQLIGIDEKGVKVCVSDANTTYSGADFALTDQKCASGEQLLGFDSDGKKVCVSDANTTYTGSNFALSNNKCGTGEVQTGVDSAGKPTCIKDSGLNVEETKSGKDAVAQTSGGWTEDLSCWGEPRFAAGGSDKPCLFTNTKGKDQAGAEFIDFAVPSGSKTAWVSVLAWTDSGFFDVFTKNSGGAWKFQRRITAHQSIQNLTSGGYDGNQVFLAATGLDHFTHVRLQNRQGRLYFAGMGFSRQDMIGSGGNGFVDWANIVNRPNVQYTSAIPADKFTETEVTNVRGSKLADGTTPWVEPADDFDQTQVDNVRASKLADGSEPWKTGSDHTHSYDVNKDRLERKDTQNFVVNGKSKQIALRADGTTEYATGVGQFPFVFMTGGDTVGDRAAALSKAELNVTGKVVGVGGVYVGATHVAKGGQDCESGKVANGVDANGALKCKTEITYNGGDFMTSDQKCGEGLVQQGVDASGKIICIEDAGFAVEKTQHIKDANDKTTGKWTEEANCWGQPRFAPGGGNTPCAYTATTGPATTGSEFAEFPIPTGMKTAYIAVRAHKDAGTFDVFTKASGGTLQYQRSITAHQNVQNTNTGDGMQVFVAATSLDGFTHIRLVNRNGRIWFGGLGYSREQKVGAGNNGHVDWTGVVNRPNVAYEAKIAADDFSQTEVDNVRGNKLADGSEPWTTGSDHTHKYDVNKDRLERSDTQNFIINGKSKQLAFRADGTTEYSTGVGSFPFVWMNGGDQTGDRAMALSKTELNVTGKVVGISGVFAGSTHVAKGNQTCGAGKQVTGIDVNGAVICAADANTTYTGTDFLKSNQTCPSGQQQIGVDDKGIIKCAADADTTYDGSDFALTNQSCTSGTLLIGFDSAGKKVCATDQNTTYSGSNFALSAKSCATGEVQTGVDSAGKPTCIKDSALNVEATLHSQDAVAKSDGSWTDDTTCWGQPRFAAGGSEEPCAFTSTVGSGTAGSEFMDFAIPTGMKTGWISVRAWKDSGHFDVFVKTGSVWKFQRRIMAYQNVQNSEVSGSDGNVVLLAATGLDHYTQVRIQNRKGRLYFSGLGFSREDMRGGASTGFIDYSNVINAPNVAYTSTIPADKFTTTEVTNVRASKLADGSTPWATGSEHTHKYDVNQDELKRSDSKHFIANGSGKSLVLRSDGNTEYSGSGSYPFVFLSGGTGLANRAAALDKNELTLKGKLVAGTGVFIGSTHVVKGNQTCSSGQQVTGVDTNGALVCGTDANTTYSGSNFAKSNQQCGSGQQLLGIDSSGDKICGTDANTTYDGKNFAVSDQTCGSGKYLVGIDADGVKICGTDANTTYSGANFAVSGKSCGTGEVQTGVDSSGDPTCIKDSGLNIESIQDGADYTDRTTGKWTDDTSCWGEPKFAAGGSTTNPCSFTATTGKDTAGTETMEFDIPSGMKTAYIAIRTWSDAGYFDIFTKTSGGAYKFQRRINAHQSVDNGSENGNHVFLAAVGLDHFASIQIRNRKGRIYFAGLGYTRQDMIGAGSNGLVHWDNVVSRPNVAYTSTIPADAMSTTEVTNLRAGKLDDGSTPWVMAADDFNQTEVDNLRAGKLDDGTTPWVIPADDFDQTEVDNLRGGKLDDGTKPWTDATQHTHKYDVNGDRIKRSDTANYIVDGKSKQIAWRSDGTTEYATGVGAHNFVWMSGGDASANRSMSLNADGTLYTKKYGNLESYFVADNQKCADGFVLKGHDSSGVPICTAAGGSDKFSATCNPGQWHRIAENSSSGSGDRFDGTFTLREEGGSGSHSSLTFRISGATGSTAGLSMALINHGRNTATQFTQTRIVTKGASDPHYFEVLCASGGTVSFTITNNQHTSGWKAVSWLGGSIPTGYTATVYDMDRLFMVASATEHLAVQRNGYVGLAGKPSHPLHVQQAITNGWQANFTNSSSVVTLAHTNQGIEVNNGQSDTGIDGYVANFRNSTGVALRVTNARRVGILTDSPTVPLHVAGKARFDDAIQVDGLTVIDNAGGFHRSYGDTGFYNGTHGGGIYMTDGTYVRVYGSKDFYADKAIRADAGYQVDTNEVIDGTATWHYAYNDGGFRVKTHGGGIYMKDTTWVRVYGSKNFRADTTDNSFQVVVADGAAAGLELRSIGATSRDPYMDFSNDASTDFDVRLGLDGNDALKLSGGDLKIATGKLTMNGGKEVIDSAGGWHISHGDTGWKSDAHGGGVYMKDTTWVRTFGDKSFLVDTSAGSVKIRPGTTASVTVRSETKNGKPYMAWSDDIAGEGDTAKDARLTLETENDGTRVLKLSTAVLDADKGIRWGGQTLWKYVSDQINSKCYLYFGWKDDCGSTCTSGPTKAAAVRGDGLFCNKDFGSSSDDNTCDDIDFKITGVHDKTVKMMGINTDGSSPANDKFWIAFKCYE